MTGSGKTYLSRFLTRSLSRLVVIDTKGTLKDWNTEDWNLTTRSKLRNNEPVRIRIVPPWEVKNVGEFLDDIILKCYQSQNVTVYIDEIYGVVPERQEASPLLKSLYTRGRELGIGVYTASQRPSWLPLVAITESEHFFSFYLQLLEDRKRMAAFMGEEVLTIAPDQYGFYYHRTGTRFTNYFSRLETIGGDIQLKHVEIKPEQSRHGLLNLKWRTK